MTQQDPLLHRRVLDSEVQASLADDGRAWGAGPWAAPLLALTVLIVAGQVIAHAVHVHGQTAVFAVAASSLVGDGLLLGVVWIAGNPVARRGGGWAATFGVRRPAADDLLPWGAGVLLAFLGQLAVGVVAADASHGRAAREAQNLRLHDVHGLGLDFLVLAVVVVAPIIEELMFRGLLLRTFMRAMPFWPAATLSTALFAGFHVYEVNSLVGAITLAASIAVLGITNCYLVRITGRLAPAVFTHASFNLLAICVLVARG